MTDETLSLSERVIDAILCRLREVRKASGYRTDAGLRVLHSVAVNDESQLPCFVVWESGEEIEAGTGSGGHESMTVTITVDVYGIVEANKEQTGRMLQRLKADAKKALLRDRGGINGSDGKGFASLAYEGSTPEPRQSGSATELVTLRFRVKFKEAYGDPYAHR